MLTRNYFFDNAKFVLIFLVVLGHALEGVKGYNALAIYKLIYLFHIPCFVFILGVFYKSINWCRIVQTIWIYLVFQALYCWFLIFVLKRPDTKLQFALPIWIMWFSLAMTVWQLSLPLILRIPFCIPIAFVIGIVVGYFDIFNYTFSASRVIVFLPFFLLGYFFGREPLKIINPLLAILVFIITFVILRFFICIPVGFLYGSNSYERLSMGLDGGGFRMLLYIINLLLIVCFFALIPKERAWFSRLGERTLNIYLIHGFAIFYAKYLGLLQAINTSLGVIVCVIGVFLLVIILSSSPVAWLMDKITNPVGLFKKCRELIKAG
jgi:Fucose 4-O-acetylase and related acetyltransferases